MGWKTKLGLGILATYGAVTLLNRCSAGKSVTERLFHHGPVAEVRAEIREGTRYMMDNMTEAVCGPRPASPEEYELIRAPYTLLTGLRGSPETASGASPELSDKLG